MGSPRKHKGQDDLNFGEVIPDRDGDYGKTAEELKDRCVHTWKTIEEVEVDGRSGKSMKCRLCTKTTVIFPIEKKEPWWAKYDRIRRDGFKSQWDW